MTSTTAHTHPRAAMGPSWIIATTALFLSAVLLLWQALTNVDRPTQELVWGSISFAAYAACLLCLIGGCREGSLGLSRWRLGSWTLLWYCIAFGLATLTRLQPQTGTAAQISMSSVLRALWLVAVGMTLWTLGYFVGPGRPAHRFGRKFITALNLRFTPEVRSPLAPWILYAICITARIAAAVTTGLFGYVGNVQSAVTSASSYQQLLSLLSLCGPLAVAAAAMQVYREHVAGARVTLTVLFLAEITFGILSGVKEGFIITILAIAIPFTIAHRRIHKSLLIFAVLAFLLVIVPFNQAYRDAARNASGTLSASQAVSAVPGILRQTVTSGDVMGEIASSAGSILSRIREIDSPAIVMQRTPSQIPFQSTVQLVEAPIVDLIPRAAWPGKPILDTGYKFSQDYYDLPPTIYTSSAITPVGDLYRHGGWIPVLVGMFLLGCATRLLDDVMDVTHNPNSVFLFLLLFTSLVKQEGDWILMLAGFPETFLVWLLATCLTFKRSGASYGPSTLGRHSYGDSFH